MKEEIICSLYKLGGVVLFIIISLGLIRLFVHGDQIGAFLWVGICITAPWLWIAETIIQLILRRFEAKDFVHYLAFILLYFLPLIIILIVEFFMGIVLSGIVLAAGLLYYKAIGGKDIDVVRYSIYGYIFDCSVLALPLIFNKII